LSTFEGRLDEIANARGERHQPAALSRKSRRAGAKSPAWIDKRIEFLDARRPYLPNYQQRQAAELWIASNRVEERNDWFISLRCKDQGMSWMSEEVLSLAVRAAARRDGELDACHRGRHLGTRRVPEVMSVAV
jgi:hypothetical protein